MLLHDPLLFKVRDWSKLAVLKGCEIKPLCLFYAGGELLKPCPNSDLKVCLWEFFLLLFSTGRICS